MAVDPSLEPRAGDILISPDYFRTMGIPVVRGREFTELDTHTSTPVVVISETLARQQFPSEDPIGRRIRINERSPMSCCVTAAPVDGIWREIVGVVGDIRQANLDEAPAATIYRPYGQIFEHDMFLMVRTRAARDTGAVAAALVPVLRGVDPTMDWWPVQADAPEHCGVGFGSHAAVRRPAPRRLRGSGADARGGRAVRRAGLPRHRAPTRNRRANGSRRDAADRPQADSRRSRPPVAGRARRRRDPHTMADAAWIASLLFGVTATDLATHLVVFVVLGTVAIARQLPAGTACRPHRPDGRPARVDEQVLLGDGGLTSEVEEILRDRNQK